MRKINQDYGTAMWTTTASALPLHERGGKAQRPTSAIATSIMLGCSYSHSTYQRKKSFYQSLVAESTVEVETMWVSSLLRCHVYGTDICS